MRGGCELWLRVLASEPGLRKPVRNQEHWGRAGWGVPLADQTASGRVRGLWLKTLLWELLAPTKVGLQWALQPPWDWGLHQCPWAAHTDPQTRWLENRKLFCHRSGVPKRLWSGGILLPAFSFWQHHPSVCLLPVCPCVFFSPYRDPRNLHVLGFRAQPKSRRISS